eukprot:11259163-Prorocentrum_lima.AAC.1
MAQKGDGFVRCRKAGFRVHALELFTEAYATGVNQLHRLSYCCGERVGRVPAQSFTFQGPIFMKPG